MKNNYNFRKIVREGYQKGRYVENYRTEKEIDGIEKRFLHKLLNNLPSNTHILDFGCGNGLPFDKYLIQNGCKITGIDINKKC